MKTLGIYPHALSVFKHLVKDLRPEDEVTMTVDSLEKFVLEAIVEALKKAK